MIVSRPSAHRAGFRTVCLMLLLLVSVSGCLSSPNPRKPNEEGLVAAVEGFNKALRWEEFREASAFLDPSAQEQFWEVADTFHNRIRITDFEIRHVAMGQDLRSATVLMHYRLYQKNNPLIQSKSLHQQWLFSGKEKGWQVVQTGLSTLLPE